MSTPPFSICALHTSPHLEVPLTAWSPDIRHHAKRKYKPRPRLPEEHAEPPEGPGGDQPAGTGGGRPPSEAGSVRSEGSRRSGRSGGSKASTATGHVAREVVVPMPSRDELGDAHTDPPLDRSPWPPGSRIRPGPSRCRPGPMGGRGISVPCGTWSWSPGGAGHLPHLLPLPHCGQGGGANLPAGQELVGMFAYRLVSVHWRVQTGVSRIGEEGTVTTAGVFWAECAHGLGAAEAGVGGRGMACHARPCGEAAEDGGG